MNKSEPDLQGDPKDLIARIKNANIVIGIVGMGYVGLPLMLAAAKKKFQVLGFDIDRPKVKRLNQGRSPLKHVPDAQIAAVRKAKRFEATFDFGRLKEVDIIVICVPTPLGRHREPDLSFVIKTARDIAKTLRRGQLVILESTTYPGTTSEIVRPILEETGHKSGRDFFLAYSPEREDPGNNEYTTSMIPKVVGGDDAVSCTIAAVFYEAFVDQVVRVSSMETAEAVKITENVFRAVNIALVNELKMIYSRMGINIFEVIDAAKTKPFGFMAFYPGPGLGGHCIPIDPFYLTWKARSLGFSTRFIELAGEINSSMPHYVIDRLVEALDERRGIGLSGAKLLVVGVAYKKNVDDIRESPALTIIELLQARNALVDYHDPHVAVIPMTRKHAKLAGMRSASIDSESTGKYDAVIIVTDHDAIDWLGLAEAAQLIVDSRNVISKIDRRNRKIVIA